MESYFDNIKEKVIAEFNNSEFMIYAAIAWITDFDIIKELTKIVKKGVQVELIINKDDKFLMRELQLNEFVENGGRLFLYPCDNDSIMHNKFCPLANPIPSKSKLARFFKTDVNYATRLRRLRLF